MKKNLLFSLWLTILTLLSSSVMGQMTTYSYTFSGKQFDANGQTKTLNGVNWTMSNDGNYYGYDSGKGQQIGSGSNPAYNLTLSTSDVVGEITSIKVSTSGANEVKANLKVQVGETTLGTTKNINSSNTEYSFTGNATGEIRLIWTQTTKKAIYIKKIEIESQIVASDMPPVVMNKTIAGTYGVLLDDGVISSIGTIDAWLTPTGTMPAGITFNNGVFSGTPTQAGTFTAYVKAANEFGESEPAEVTFDIAKMNQSLLYMFTNMFGNINQSLNNLPTQTDQGFPIEYISNSNAVRAEGNVLYFENVGTATIQVKAVGDDNFNDYVNSFTVRVVNPANAYTGIGVFEKVTHNEGVRNGYYVIANELSQFVMTNQNGGSYFTSTNLSLLTDFVYKPEMAWVWKGDVNENNQLSLFNETEEVYVGYTGSSNSSSAEESLSDKALWTFNYEDDKFTLKNVATSDRQLSYNAGSPRFAAYTNANQQELQLYKLADQTIWNGTSWTNGEPTINKYAIVTGPLDITADFAAKTIIVDGNGQVNVKAGATLTVVKSVINQLSAEKLVIEAGAQLIQQDENGVNLGNSTVLSNYHKPLNRLEMMMWSSPVQNQNILAVSPLTLTNRFVRYNEPSNNFQIVANPAEEIFQPAEMIGMRTPNNFANFGAAPSLFTANFSGIPNNGTIAIPVTNDNEGFNGVGNPYPSTLNIDELIAHNSALNINRVFFWTNSGNTDAESAASGNNWGVYNALGANEPTFIVNGQVNIGQGFVVEVRNAGQLEFTNEMRGTQSSANRTTNKDRFWLTAKQGEQTLNSILVGYTANATAGLDENYDAKPLSQNHFLYSKVENDYLLIQAKGDQVAENDVIPLAIHPTVEGQFTIELNQMEGVFANGEYTIYLRDRLTNQIVNLSEEREYTFITEAGIIDNRFEVIYTPRVLGTADLNAAETVVYKENNAIVIQAKQPIQSVQVMDITGRVIHSSQPIQQTSVKINSSLKSAVVVVTIQLKDGSIVNKKMIL